MTETTISKSAFDEQNNVLHERSECKNIDAADIAIIVNGAVRQKAPRNACVIEAKPIVAGDYVDPVDGEYKILRRNKIGSIENRESAEGIASLHAFFSGAGDMAEF